MLAKKNLVKLAILLIAGTALLSAVCFAAEQTPEAEPPKPVKVQGVVNVTEDANEITTVTVVTKDEVVYNIVLNIKGLNLGKEMADKEVEVEGIVSTKGTQNWMNVLSYTAVENAPSAAPKTE